MATVEVGFLGTRTMEKGLGLTGSSCSSFSNIVTFLGGAYSGTSCKTLFLGGHCLGTAKEYGVSADVEGSSTFLASTRKETFFFEKSKGCDCRTTSSFNCGRAIWCDVLDFEKSNA